MATFEDKNKSRQEGSDRSSAWKGAQYFNYVVFLVAVGFLSVILYVGYTKPEIHSNLIYLFVLSLSSAMVFAFLPIEASFQFADVFKAGGTAAVFGFSLFSVLHFTGNSYDEKLKNANSQLSNLDYISKSKDEQIQRLSTLIDDLKAKKDACSSQAEALRGLLDQAFNTSQALRSDVQEAIQFSSAARDNYSDSHTCSTRGSQSLAALSRGAPKLDIIQSALASATKIIK